MKYLFFNPVRFFKSLRNDIPSIWLPSILIISTGILNGMSSIINEGNITLVDLFNGKFPVIKFIYLSLIFNITFYVLIALQTFFFPLIVKKLGGEIKSKKFSFYILGISSIPILIQSIIHIFFPATIAWNYFKNNDIIYMLIYKVFNVFNIWSILLLIVGFACVYNISYKKASILYINFIIKFIPLLLIKFLS